MLVFEASSAMVYDVRNLDKFSKLREYRHFTDNALT